MSKKEPDHQLDIRGKVCPYITLETCLFLKKMGAGEVLEVITDYYPARETIPNLVGEMGYSCELIGGDEIVFRFLIHKVS